MLRRFLGRTRAAVARPVLERLDHISRDVAAHGRHLKRLASQYDELSRALRDKEAHVPPPEPLPEPRREIALPDNLIPLAMKDPARARRRLQREAEQVFGPGARLGEDVRVTFPLDRMVPIPHAEFWKDPGGQVVASATDELIGALEGFSLDVFKKHLGPHVGYDLAGYLRQTRIRVIAALEELRRRGFAGARILDLGSLYGAFALPLQRLGFQVTAVDRYREYTGLESLVGLLRGAGVQVIETTRSDELAVFDSLGSFDVVISMAVLEHIPHTPRFFLEGLRSHVRSGGLLLIDTPNLVRYWNRAAVNEGRSMFMNLASQFYAEIPFEGHHREYTGKEVAWMLEQIGCADVRVQYVESNLFQFEVVDRPHLECLVAIVEDPTKADTVLASGLL